MAKYWKPKLMTETKVRTGKCRLSFPHLYEKYEKSGKYQGVFMWSKEDKEMNRAMKTGIEGAKKKGMEEKWGGKLPKNYEGPIRDGDESEYKGYEGCYYITAKNGNRKPEVIDLDKDLILDPEEVYPGCYVRATISFFAYNNSGNGVGCILNNVQKLEDGEQLGGGASSAEDDFGDDDDDFVDDVEDTDDDDLLG